MKIFVCWVNWVNVINFETRVQVILISNNNLALYGIICNTQRYQLMVLRIQAAKDQLNSRYQSARQVMEEQPSERDMF